MSENVDLNLPWTGLRKALTVLLTIFRTGLIIYLEEIETYVFNVSSLVIFLC